MGSSKPHYFAIGVFVIVATALGLTGVVLLTSDAMRSPERFIETYVDESVQGIDVGTPFKLRGVKVGSVSEIGMVSTVYDTTKMYVMIRVALDNNLVITGENGFQGEVTRQVKEGLRLKLVPQGITGLSFVEADFFPDSQFAALDIDWEPNCLYVPSTPATLTLVSRSLERLSVELDSLDLSAIGDNIETLTSNLNVSMAHFDQILASAAGASDAIISNVSAASDDLPTITSNLNATVKDLDSLINASDRDIEQILTNFRYISDDARELIRQVKRHPGMLLSEPPESSLKR